MSEDEVSRVLGTVATIRAELRDARAAVAVDRQPPARAAGPLTDLLLAPVSDEVLRLHLARTVRCVRQRSLSDFLL